MITRVVTGHSFKGVMAYLAHDKGREKTSHRVDFVHTHNLNIRTDHDERTKAEKAARIMAFTAQNSTMLKQQSGVKLTGNKAERGAVWHEIISWSREDDPSREQMIAAGQSMLQAMELDRRHQAFFLAHNDEKQKHMHIIVNLVSWEDGRRANIYRDHLRLSRWADEYAKEHGFHRIAQRIKNNKQRDKGEFVKYKAREIADLYHRCDNARSFAAALEEKGITLAQGHKRDYILVDHRGEGKTLSRYLKGIKIKEIRAKLGDKSLLPQAHELEAERRRAWTEERELEKQAEREAAEQLQEREPQNEQEMAKQHNRRKPALDRDEARDIDRKKQWHQNQIDRLDEQQKDLAERQQEAKQRKAEDNERSQEQQEYEYDRDAEEVYRQNEMLKAADENARRYKEDERKKEATREDQEREQVPEQKISEFERKLEQDLREQLGHPDEFHHPDAEKLKRYRELREQIEQWQGERTEEAYRAKLIEVQRAYAQMRLDEQDKRTQQRFAEEYAKQAYTDKWYREEAKRRDDQARRGQLEIELEKIYGREQAAGALKSMDERIQKARDGGFFERRNVPELEQQRENMRKSLENIDQRMNERREMLEWELNPEKMQQKKAEREGQTQQPEQEITPRDTFKQKANELEDISERRKQQEPRQTEYDRKAEEYVSRQMKRDRGGQSLGL